MTKRLNYKTNPNGKLFCDTYSDLRLHDPEKFYRGAIIQVYYQNMQMGTVQVMAVRTITFKQITDVLSYLVCGKPAAYLAAQLRSYYENTDTELTADTKFDHVVLQYTSRNLESHAYQLQEWWNQTRTLQEQPQTQNSNT